MIVHHVPYTFHAVELLPPRAKRAKFPFVGFIDFQGLEIDVENARGDVREGVDGDGHRWRSKMHAHYGEIRGTEGTDGDKLDVYVGPNADSSLVVVVHQNDPVTGRYDEDKVILGFRNAKQALALYRKQYDRPGFYGSHDVMPIGRFWRWVHDRKNLGKRVEKAGGPYIGPRGGKWADPAHTIPWNPYAGKRTLGVPEADVRRVADELVSSSTRQTDQDGMVEVHRFGSTTVNIDGTDFSVRLMPAHGQTAGSMSRAAQEVKIFVPLTPISKDQLAAEIRQTLAHELTHAKDPTRIPAGGTSLVLKKRGYAEYLNHPLEVTATRHEVFRELNTPSVARSVQNWIRRNEGSLAELAKEIVRGYARGPHMKGLRITEVYRDLSPENRKKMLRMVAALLQSHADGTSSPIEKAGGPYVGPRGGKWADPAHTIPWHGETYAGPGYVSTSRFPDVDRGPELARKWTLRLKAGDPVAARWAAGRLANRPELAGFKGVVVPVPRSTPERAPHMHLARALVSYGVGTHAVEGLMRTAPVESSRVRRRRGEEGLTAADHAATMVARGIHPDMPVLLVDDVVTSGATFDGAEKALRAAGHRGPILRAAAARALNGPGEFSFAASVVKGGDRVVCAGWVDDSRLFRASGPFVINELKREFLEPAKRMIRLMVRYGRESELRPEDRALLAEMRRLAPDDITLRPAMPVDGIEKGGAELKGWTQISRSEWFALRSMIAKGASHKYLKRVPTGKTSKGGKPLYRYYYKPGGGAGNVLHDAHLSTVGAGFKVGDANGHAHIEAVHGDGHVTLRHDETGRTERVHVSELRRRVEAAHGAAQGAHDAAAKARRAAELAAAEKHGSQKQKEAARKRAGVRAGHGAVADRLSAQGFQLGRSGSVWSKTMTVDGHGVEFRITPVYDGSFDSDVLLSWKGGVHNLGWSSKHGSLDLALEGLERDLQRTMKEASAQWDAEGSKMPPRDREAKKRAKKVARETDRRAGEKAAEHAAGSAADNIADTVDEHPYLWETAHDAAVAHEDAMRTAFIDHAGREWTPRERQLAIAALAAQAGGAFSARERSRSWRGYEPEVQPATPSVPEHFAAKVDPGGDGRFSSVTVGGTRAVNAMPHARAEKYALGFNHYAAALSSGRITVHDLHDRFDAIDNRAGIDGADEKRVIQDLVDRHLDTTKEAMEYQQADARLRSLRASGSAPAGAVAAASSEHARARRAYHAAGGYTGYLENEPSEAEKVRAKPAGVSWANHVGGVYAPRTR